MTREYIPQALRQIILDVYADKRLKNRKGQAHCRTCKTIIHSGKILDCEKQASSHDQDHDIVIIEESCRHGLI